MKIEPDYEFGQIKEHTEICVEPKKRQGHIIPLLQELFSKKANGQQAQNVKSRSDLKGQLLRVVPSADFDHPFCCYILCRNYQPAELIEISKVSPRNELGPGVKVKVHFKPSEYLTESLDSSLYISPVLFSGLKLGLGEKVMVKNSQSNYPKKSVGKLQVKGLGPKRVNNILADKVPQMIMMRIFYFKLLIKSVESFCNAMKFSNCLSAYIPEDFLFHISQTNTKFTLLSIGGPSLLESSSDIHDIDVSNSVPTNDETNWHPM